ncbi:MAG: PIN domain-containing protein [Gaiellaceae bacterium]
MTIVVDTNFLPQNADLQSVELQLLVAAASETGHELVLPSLVLEEASSRRRREIEEAFDSLLTSTRSARRFAQIPLPADLPVPGELAATYEDQLRQIFSIASLPEDAGAEALRREVNRLRPTREGRGARDAAIWLTVKDVHTRGNGSMTVFLSANVKDFGSQGALHEDLRQEIALLPGAFVYCKSIAEVLATIAQAEPNFVDIAYLTNAPEIAVSIGEAMRVTEALGAVELPPDFQIPLSLADSPRPVDVSDVRVFSVEGLRVAVGWTKWLVSLTGPAGTTSNLTPVELESSVQILVRETGDAPKTETEVLAIRAVRLVG